MRQICLTCAILGAAVTAGAQDAASPPSSMAMNDAISWAGALREPMRRMGDPVITTYGIASLGAILCPADSGIGADLFREAIVGLNGLSDNVFQDARKALPVASFSGLWRVVVTPGVKCDPRLPQPSDSARAKREFEKRQSNVFLSQAKFTDDYERAAQLATAAIEVGDPNTTDITPITQFLIQFRDPAPDLADDVFQRATGFASGSEIPNVQEFADLGNYLFIDPKLQTGSEPILNRTTYKLNGSTFFNWGADHDNANPDVIQAYVGAAADLLSKPESASVDLVAAYAMAYQLLGKAKDLELDSVDALQKAVDRIQAQNPTVAAEVEAKFGSSIGSGAGQTNLMRLIAAIRGAMNAGKFAQAREILRDVDGVTVRSRIATIIDFYEAVYAARGKNFDHAMELAGALPGGVKRALAYTSITALAQDKVTAITALHLGLKDAQLLSYEQRISYLPAMAGAAMAVDAEESLAVLNQLIASYNDANSRPRKSKFSPWNSGVFDGPRMVFGPMGFTEVVSTGSRMLPFSLKVPGVDAYSLDGFVAHAKGMDFLRLSSAFDNLHNDVQLIRAYLALAKLRLAMAKVSTEAVRK